MRSLSRALSPSVLAAVLTACASSSANLPTYAPDRAIPLPESTVSQIRTAAIRHFGRDAQQIMCVGVSANFEMSGSPMVVDAPEIFLRLLGSRDQFRQYSQCRTSASGGSAGVRTVSGQTATIITLGRPFGLADGRAVVNLWEWSSLRNDRYRCMAEISPDGVWAITRCRREWGGSGG